MTTCTTAKTRSRRLSLSTAAAVAAISLATATPADAAPLDPVDVMFTAGQVCAFPLRVQGTGGNQVVKDFPGPNGDQITVSAGTGYDLVFTNVVNEKKLRLPSRVSSTTTITHPDGSKTVVLAGWNVLFLFPTDVPAGPSTTLHVGIVVYEDDGNANFTVDQHLTRSRTTDICATVT